MPPERVEEYKRRAEEAMEKNRKELFQKIRNSVQGGDQPCLSYPAVLWMMNECLILVMTFYCTVSFVAAASCASLSKLRDFLSIAER